MYLTTVRSTKRRPVLFLFASKDFPKERCSFWEAFLLSSIGYVLVFTIGVFTGGKGDCSRELTPLAWNGFRFERILACRSDMQTYLGLQLARCTCSP